MKALQNSPRRPPSELCNELLALHFYIRGKPKEGGHDLGDDDDVTKKYKRALKRAKSTTQNFQHIRADFNYASY